MEADGRELNIAGALAVLRRRKWWLIIPPLLCATLAFAWESGKPRIWQANAQVLIESPQIETEMALVTSQAVREAVVERLGADVAANVTAVEARRVGETQLVNIIARARSPELAEVAADAFATEFATQRNSVQLTDLRAERDRLAVEAEQLSAEIVDLQNEIDRLRAQPPDQRDTSRITALTTQLSQLEARQRELNQRVAALDLSMAQVTDVVTIVEEARSSGGPVQPRPARAALAALFAGMLLAATAVTLLEMVDDRIRSEDDLNRWVPGVPVLGSLPPVPRRDPLVVLHQRDHAGAEAFRMLRTSLALVARSRPRPVRRLLVTSAASGEGKTTLVANLSVAFAQGNASVVAIDGDLRRPGLHLLLDGPSEPGLVTAVADDLDPQSVRYPVPGTAGRLHLVPCGGLPPSPAEFASSPELRRFLSELAGDTNFTIIDSAPVLAVSDTLELAAETDGVILVARYRRTRGRTLRAAAERVRRTGAPLLGVVLVADPTHRDTYYSAAYHAPPSRAGVRRTARARGSDAPPDDAGGRSAPESAPEREADPATAPEDPSGAMTSPSGGEPWSGARET